MSTRTASGPIDYGGLLTGQQVEQYRDLGYLAINGVLDDMVAELQAVTDDFVERSRDVDRSGEVFDLEPNHTREVPRLRRLKEPHKQHRVFERVLKDQRILDIVSQLVGEAFWFRQSKLNIKGAEIGSPVEWHQDWAFIPFTNDDSLAVGVPLDDMSIENGCLMVVPESHRDEVMDHHQNGRFVGAVSPDGLSERAVPIELKAGGISIHHIRLLHGSAPNTSPRSRRLLLFQYVAADAWPLTEATQWKDVESRMLRGQLTSQPRLAEVPVRLPYPRDPSSSIFEVQGAARFSGLFATKA